MACCCFCFCNFLAVIGTTAFCETSPKAGRRAGEWDPQEIDTAQRRRRCVFIECVQQALRVFAQFVALECANYTHIYIYIHRRLGQRVRAQLKAIAGVFGAW